MNIVPCPACADFMSSRSSSVSGKRRGYSTTPTIGSVSINDSGNLRRLIKCHFLFSFFDCVGIAKIGSNDCIAP
jgi:hypothetical protein